MHHFVLSHCHKEVVKGSPTLSVVEFFETVNRIVNRKGLSNQTVEGIIQNNKARNTIRLSISLNTTYLTIKKDVNNRVPKARAVTNVNSYRYMMFKLLYIYALLNST